MYWLGDATFLNLKKSYAKVNNFEQQQIIEWSFNEYTYSQMPFYFFECKMVGMGFESKGYGVSRNSLNAVRKSFAEAWERLWFEKISGDESEISESNIMSTNGFAAGPTGEIAAASAKGELIERAVLLAAWSDHLGWCKSSIHMIRNRFLITAFMLKGWHIQIYDINSNLGLVKACIASHKNLGTVFDTCFTFNKVDAESKVLDSVLKSIFFQKKVDNFILPDKGGPEDHRLFYADPKNFEAFAFLKNCKFLTSTVLMQQVNKTVVQILHEPDLFPAVAYAKNDYWPQFKWGQQSIKGINKWPHPLA